MKPVSIFEATSATARTALALGVLAIAPIAYAQETQTLPSPPVGGMSGGIDKSGDTVLQAMIGEVVPTFVQSEYVDEPTGLTVPYNIYLPSGYDAGEPLPLVYFIADSSVVGGEITAPLTQGYGGLIWATEADQEEHPSLVLVPQFPEVIIDDHGAFTTTAYVDIAARLVESVAAEYNADPDRLYATGQSMGCMTLMVISAQHPDLFAAQLFVSGQWDVAELTPLADQTFFYTAAAGDAKASQGQIDLLAALTAQGAEVGTATWDATWTQDQMSEAVAALLAEGHEIYFATFAGGSVMPEGTEAASGAGAGEHMYSFDPAYKIDALRDWLFARSK